MHFACFQNFLPFNYFFINACLPNLTLLYTILFVIKKRRDLCIIKPYYHIWEVFRANEKVGERLYPSVALESKQN